MQHYNESDLSVNQIASILCFTPSWLCQVFKAGTGITIKDYINRVRIDEAKTLLQSRSIKLYEVAIRVGYNDSNYFTRQFKKYTGMIPSEYREKI